MNEFSIVEYTFFIAFGICVVSLIFSLVRSHIIIKKLISIINDHEERLTELKNNSELNFNTIRSNFNEIDKRIQKLTIERQAAETTINSKLKKLQSAARKNIKVPTVFSEDYQRRLTTNAKKRNKERSEPK